MTRLIALAVGLVAGAAYAQAIVPTPAFDTTGLCGVSMSCEVASLTSSGTVVSQAASGQYSFQPTVAGSRLGMGPGTNQFWSCPDAVKCVTDTQIQPRGGLDMFNGVLADSYTGVVTVNTDVGFGLALLSAVPTCAADYNFGGAPKRGRPGTLVGVVSATPGTKPLRLCLCTYDGTTYRWHNLLAPSDVTGTSTTCPEFP